MKRRLGSFLASALAALATVATAFAGSSTWCLKIVDDQEQPVADAQVFYRWDGFPDWRPVEGTLRLGDKRDGGGFQTVGETVSNLRNDPRSNEQFLRLPLNYLFRTSAPAAHGYLKITHRDFQPAELRVPFPSGDYKWERVQLVRREDARRGPPRATGGMPENRVASATLRVLVLDEHDQRTAADDTPLGGATLTVVMEASGRRFETRTNPAGEAVLQLPEPGRAQVDITCPGFRPKSWRTNIESGRNEEQRMTLLALRGRK